ncbi:MAG: NAD(P)H-dependent oxidoreductase [Bacteroidales bacterium]|nr:NAD(P)H-dependent oxidoreductase [Bacteroidales bacterium]
MDRRDFLKESAIGIAALAFTSLLDHQVAAAPAERIKNRNSHINMKKIIVIDGGPRPNMNTAQMLQKFAEGARSQGADIEVKTVRLYELDYNDYSLTAPKRMPVVLIETLNGSPLRNNSNGYGSMEHCIKIALGEPRHVVAYNTYQVKNYDRYELAGFSEEAKRKWRDEHWEEDLQKAFDAGRRMAAGI